MKKHVGPALVILIIFSFGFLGWAKKTRPQSSPIPYKDVRIKQFPLAIACYTYREFSFFETVEKAKELGIQYLGPYEGQALSRDLPEVSFDPNLTDSQIELTKKKLSDAGLILVSYGVAEIGTTETSMRKVFDFAKKLGIPTILAEPKDDDFTLLERLVKEYNIRIAIHNHAAPSKYALPQTILDHVKGRDERIGSCADTGHWMRSNINPLDALRLLKSRIIDVHLKDRNGYGTENVQDVSPGLGKANIHDILAELTLQNYGGYIGFEYENEDESHNPSPALKKAIEYIKSITF
jgi:sugar phosphate isomerase/epimerase